MSPVVFEPKPSTPREVNQSSRPLGHLVRYQVEFYSLTVSWFMNENGNVTIHVWNWLFFFRFNFSLQTLTYCSQPMCQSEKVILGRLFSNPIWRFQCCLWPSIVCSLCHMRRRCGKCLKSSLHQIRQNFTSWSIIKLSYNCFRILWHL